MAKKNTGGVIAGLGFGAAAGLALGALVVAPNTPGLGADAKGGDADIRSEYQRILKENHAKDEQIGAGDEFTKASQEAILKDRLKDRPVTVIRTEDANDFDTAAVRHNLGEAGAIDAGEIKLTQKFSDRNSADSLKSILSNTLPAGAQLSENNVEAGTHGGEALAYAIGMNPDDAEPLASVEERAELLQALRDADFIDYKDKTILPAQAVVVVTSDGAADGYYTSTISGFARGVNDVVKHTVVAGRAKAADDGGVIADLRRGESKVSTVDSLDRGWARIAVPLAVAEQLGGKAGAYGAAASASAPAPDFEHDGKKD